MNVTHASAKGHRPYMEDFSNVIETPQGVYCAVWDGHGGPDVAAYAVAALPTILHTRPELKDALAELNSQTRHMDAGSTASLVFIPTDESRVDVAVLGDSPVLVSHPDGSIWVSPEHNVRSNEAEADAAIKRGGFLAHGYLFSSHDVDGLQMSRALGDAYLDKVLSREPEVFTHVLGKDSWVLVCSDGAVDPGHGAAKANIDAIVRMIEDEDADAQDIVDRALAIPTLDNVSAILVRL
jgi:serine/threonine protein phosphatase PrpC